MFLIDYIQMYGNKIQIVLLFRFVHLKIKEKKKIATCKTIFALAIDVVA